MDHLQDRIKGKPKAAHPRKQTRPAWMQACALVLLVLLAAGALTGCTSRSGRRSDSTPGHDGNGGPNVEFPIEIPLPDIPSGQESTPHAPPPAQAQPSTETSQPSSEPTIDYTEQRFQQVERGSCLPIYQISDGVWSESSPPAAVSCNSAIAGVFKVMGVNDPYCTWRSTDHVTWSYKTTTLCLDRVWTPRYCVPAQISSNNYANIVGDNLAVDCYARRVPLPYNDILAVTRIIGRPTNNYSDCAESAGDRRTFWLRKVDDGSSTVCLARPT